MERSSGQNLKRRGRDAISLAEILVMALDLSEEQLVNGLIVDGDAVPSAEVRQ